MAPLPSFIWFCPLCKRDRKFDPALPAIGRECHGWKVVVYQGVMLEKVNRARKSYGRPGKSLSRRALTKWIAIEGKEAEIEYNEAPI